MPRGVRLLGFVLPCYRLTLLPRVSLYIYPMSYAYMHTPLHILSTYSYINNKETGNRESDSPSAVRLFRPLPFYFYELQEGLR
jgi:hypothetical protein